MCGVCGFVQSLCVNMCGMGDAHTMRVCTGARGPWQVSCPVTLCPITLTVGLSALTIQTDCLASKLPGSV